MWRLVVDAADGRAYHWNEATGETRWDAPPLARREPTALAPQWLQQAEEQIEAMHRACMRQNLARCASIGVVCRLTRGLRAWRSWCATFGSVRALACAIEQVLDGGVRVRILRSELRHADMDVEALAAREGQLVHSLKHARVLAADAAYERELGRRRRGTGPQQK